VTNTRFPWAAIPALILGIAVGLLYAWVLAPVQVVDSAPEALRPDFKDQYRAVIAAAYAANGDLTSAQARLNLLGDADTYQALSSQAQRTLSSGDTLQSFQLAQLASAVQGTVPTSVPSTPTSFAARTVTPVDTVPTSAVLNPEATDIPISTEDPQLFYTATPRPKRTPVPPPGAPFELASQETVCDESLAEGLLQVVTMTTARRQIPGIELILTWAGGEEHFFTGIKPEISNGYADAQMSPGVLYNLRTADGGTLVTGLTPPSCQKVNGETYFGSLSIVFQRP
jgi:hypothetical protein